MPIYLCQPGAGSKEPWRHGVQVYERPFPLNDSPRASPAPRTSIDDGPEQVVVVVAGPDDKAGALRRCVDRRPVVVFCDPGRFDGGLMEGIEGLRDRGLRPATLCLEMTGEERAAVLMDFKIGIANVLAVEDGAAELIEEFLTTNDLPVRTVINYDLRSLTIETYLARLQYTPHKVVTFFDPSEDGAMARELAQVLKMHGQPVPERLGEPVPPPPTAPPGSPSSLVAAAGGRGEFGSEPLARGGDDGRGRPGNAVPSREDSRSPVPHYREGGTDAPARLGGDGGDDDGDGDAGEGGSGGGNDADDDRNPENEDGDDGGEGGRHRRQRQFSDDRNARPTSSRSGDDDDDGRRGGGDAAPVDAAERPRPTLRRSPSASGRTAAREAGEESAGEGTAPPAREGPERSRPNPVRRVRHAEVVLADQCMAAYGRTWLRLRWPGERGGFGGFVALSRAEKGSDFKKAALQDGGYVRMLSGRGDDRSLSGTKTAEEESSGEDAVLCREVGASSPPPPPAAATAASGAARASLLCEETGVRYPTSAAMKLLVPYDDGLGGRCAEEGGRGMEDILKTAGENGEPVFCRICREGLHDVNYGPEAAPPPAEGGGKGAAAAGDDGGGADAPRRDDVPPPPFDARRSLAGLPPVVARHPAAENPLLAPCDCAGTMAFVHYLCVEQWRCRSRHPGAREGRSCETCGAGYALPPPPGRPAGGDAQGMDGAGGPGGGVVAEDDWLDAMPPHVLAALRRPHPAWRLGAAAARRRWLRPVVPVLASPLVALYCRARRTLKKRGVSRRRWACSLCRRRARWKCVRCLRSYYCSRQCQNVSWHIVHKHVCYKPVRFWWSVVVYTAGVFMAVPGLVENFPVYDAMVTLLPLNFIALGIVFGGIASALKRSSGIDVRGRVLEIIVVLQTLQLTGVTSGLVRGYFGEPERCRGAFHSAAPAAITSSTFAVDTALDAMGTKEGESGVLGKAAGVDADGVEAPTLTGPFPHPLLNAALVDVPLGQIRLWYLKWDFILSKLGPLSRKFLCTPPDVFDEVVVTHDGSVTNKADVATDAIDYSVFGCSPPTRTINPKFYLEPSGGGRCSSDMSLVLAVWFAALGMLLLGNAWRHLRGARRNGGGGGGGDRRDRGRRRVHHDHQD